MNSLKIESTTFTPEINFDIANNTLSFLKVSKPANAIDFYGPVFEFIDNFDYFNTATAKIIYELLARFKKIQKQGVNIIINWYYHPDDEDQLEEGQIMSEALDLPFQYIPLEEDNIIE
ncbi:MAG: DUF1987 domain-containing protein [Bacteroidales bacterium]|nr:DUF1987 domain-containing protein [Bacteroidales bacterium]